MVSIRRFNPVSLSAPFSRDRKSSPREPVYKAKTVTGRQASVAIRIRDHLKVTGTKPTSFGRVAMGDPNFVNRLFSNENMREATLDKVEQWLDNWEASRAK